MDSRRKSAFSPANSTWTVSRAGSDGRRNNEARSLWQVPDLRTLKGKIDRAILAVLLDCGLRRAELTELTFAHLQRREEHGAIVDLVGKGGHIRTVPVPDWVKQAIDEWLAAARVTEGKISRRVCRTGMVWGTEMAEKVVWQSRDGLGTGADRRPQPMETGNARRAARRVHESASP
jgi:integrase